MSATSRPTPTLSRRAAARLGAGGLAATLAAHGLAKPTAAAATEPATPATTEPATFVLVPGLWTGGYVWHNVGPRLRAAGHVVHAVTCTGLGERVHLASPTLTLDDFITDVINVLEYEDLHDVTLVGHSFSGMVITGVAERVPERLAQLVYLDALVPADGQNFYYDLAFISEETYNEVIAADIAAAMSADVPGFVPLSPDIEEWVRASIKDPAEAEWILARAVPHPLLTMLQPVRVGNPAAAALPRAYILCTADKDLEADPQTNAGVIAAEQARSDPNWTVLELDGNHLAPMDDPQATAEALLSLV